jgi:L-malate glycosyltransferase
MNTAFLTNFKNQTKRVLSIAILSSVYGAGIVINFITRRKNNNFNESGYIAVIGVFHNPNWFKSHVIPLTRANAGRVILITDSPLKKVDNLEYFCPPQLLSILLSRAGAKFIWSIVCGIKYRPDLYVGYHIFPAGVTASICGSIFGRPSCYQITSGKLEIEGGGYKAENRLLVALNKPTAQVEQLALQIISKFSLLVVRGNDAKKYLRKNNIKNRISIITGSTDIMETDDEEAPLKDIDLIFVGRLSETKRPHIFIDIIRLLKEKFPNINAVIAGDGPEKDHILKLIKSHNLESNIQLLGQVDHVETWLLRSKVFVLTSRWEGVSISMLEAMACGSVPIVSNVGDLKDIIKNDINGYLIEAHHQPHEYANHAQEILHNDAKRERLAQDAKNTSIRISDVRSVSSKWSEIIAETILDFKQAGTSKQPKAKD